MSRRARRPAFHARRQEKLLHALNDARYRAIMCGAAAGYGSPRYLKTHAVTQAIDALAEELTGYRNLFHDLG